MEQITEFFSGLTSVSDWPPRWKCGTWSDFHGWLYIISDLLIWFAYFLIPVIIINYITKKKAVLKFNKAYVFFAAFILLCGTTHLLDAIMFWAPMYRLNALVRFLTAIVSLVTLYHLINILPQAFVQKTSIELEKEIALRKVMELRLETANKSLEAFASMASHDLQEPLRKISTFSSQLSSKYGSAMETGELELVNKIDSAAGRLRVLVTDTLALADVQQDMQLEKISLDEVMQMALDRLELKMQDSGAEVRYGSLPQVKGNKNYLTQVFVNIIGNALKFNDKKPAVEISYNKQDGQTQVFIKDNGIGIAPENSEKIFGEFQRLHNKKDYEGSGLGLAICKKIIVEHGGTIKVESIMGESSTFIITLQSA